MRACLQFSGGKDSLALLFHMEALLPFIDVVMLDTGDMSTAAYTSADIARSIAPRFLVVKPEHVRGGVWVDCCYRNIWAPMHEFIKGAGYKQVFRGTKRCDPHFHGVYPGDIFDGAVYTMPLWDWSDADVKSYLGDKLPEGYLMGATGMPDCLTCPHPEACGGKNKEVWRK